MSLSKRILKFYRGLPSDLNLPKGIELIYPFNQAEVKKLMSSFYTKYYSDDKPRVFLWGINPGRFGAGITGIPFTDPKMLEERCGISNGFDKRFELSSVFIYDLIERMGGPEMFYSKYYISSLCPLGFIKQGKNYNYYDDKSLFESVYNFMIQSIEHQLSFQEIHKSALSLGKGKNLKIFKDLNEKFNWFDRIESLPHPRWVMQYQKKNYEEHMRSIIDTLDRAYDF